MLKKLYIIISLVLFFCIGYFIRNHSGEVFPTKPVDAYQVNLGGSCDMTGSFYGCSNPTVSVLYNDLMNTAVSKCLSTSWPNYTYQTGADCPVVNTVYNLDYTLADVRAGLFACVIEKRISGEIGDPVLRELLTKLKGLGTIKIGEGLDILFTKNTARNPSEVLLSYYGLLSGSEHVTIMNSNTFSGNSIYKYIKYISDTYSGTSLTTPNPYNPISIQKVKLDSLSGVNIAKISTGILNNYSDFISNLPVLAYDGNGLTRTNTNKWAYNFMLNYDDDLSFKLINSLPYNNQIEILDKSGRICLGGDLWEGTTNTLFSGDMGTRNPCYVPSEYYDFNVASTGFDVVKNMYLRDDVFLYSFLQSSNNNNIIGPINNYKWHYKTALYRGLGWTGASSFIDKLTNQNLINKNLIVGGFGYLDWDYKKGILITGDESSVKEIPALCKNLLPDTVANLYHTFENIVGDSNYGGFSDILLRRQMCINKSGKADQIMQKLIDASDLASVASYIEIQSDANITGAVCGSGISNAGVKSLIELYDSTSRTGVGAKIMNLMAGSCLDKATQVTNITDTTKISNIFNNTGINISSIAKIFNNRTYITTANGVNIIHAMSGLSYSRLLAVSVDTNLTNDKLSDYLVDGTMNVNLARNLGKDFINSDVTDAADVFKFIIAKSETKFSSTIWTDLTKLMIDKDSSKAHLVVKDLINKNISLSVDVVKLVGSQDGYSGLVIEENAGMINSQTGYVQKLFKSSVSQLSVPEGAKVLYSLMSWNSGGVITGTLERTIVNAIDDDYMFKVISNLGDLTGGNLMMSVGRYCGGGDIINGTNSTVFTGDVGGRYPCYVPSEYYSYDSTILAHQNKFKDMIARNDIYMYSYQGSNYDTLLGPISNYKWHYRTGLYRGQGMTSTAKFIDRAVSQDTGAKIDSGILVAAFGYLDWNYKTGSIVTGDEMQVKEITSLCQALSGDTIVKLYHVFSGVNNNPAYGNFTDMIERRQICINRSGKADYIAHKLIEAGDISYVADYMQTQTDLVITGAACGNLMSTGYVKDLIEYYDNTSRTNVGARILNLMSVNCLNKATQLTDLANTSKISNTFNNANIQPERVAMIMNNTGFITKLNGINIIENMSGLSYSRLYTVLTTTGIVNSSIAWYISDVEFDTGLDIKITKNMEDSVLITKAQDIIKLQTNNNLSKTVGKIKQMGSEDGYSGFVIEENAGIINSQTGYVQRLFKSGNNQMSVIEGSKILYGLTTWNTGGILTGRLERNIINAIDDDYMFKITTNLGDQTGGNLMMSVGRYCMGGDIMSGSGVGSYTGDVGGRFPCSTPDTYFDYANTIAKNNDMKSIMTRNDIYLYTYQGTNYDTLLGPISNYAWHYRTSLYRGLGMNNAASFIDRAVSQDTGAKIDSGILVAAFGYLDWNYKTSGITNSDEPNVKEITSLCQALSGDTIAKLYHVFETVNGNPSYGNFSDMLARRQICINKSNKLDYIMNKLIEYGDISSVASYMQTQTDLVITGAACGNLMSTGYVKDLIEYYDNTSRTDIGAKVLNLMTISCLNKATLVSDSGNVTRITSILNHQNILTGNVAKIFNNTGFISVTNGVNIISTLSGLNYTRLYGLLLDTNLSTSSIARYISDNSFDQTLDVKITKNMINDSITRIQDITRLQINNNLTKTVGKIKQMGSEDGYSGFVIEENAGIINSQTGYVQRLFKSGNNQMSVIEGSKVLYGLTTWNTGGISTGTLERNIINAIDDDYMFKITTNLGDQTGGNLMMSVGRYCAGGDVLSGSTSSSYTGDIGGRFPCYVPSQYYSLTNTDSIATTTPVSNMYYRNDVYMYTYQGVNYDLLLGPISNYSSIYKTSVIRGLGTNAAWFLNQYPSLKTDFCSMIYTHKGSSINLPNGIWVTQTEFDTWCPGFTVSYFNGAGSSADPYRGSAELATATTVSAKSCQSYNTGATTLNNGSARGAGTCGNGSQACLSDGIYMIDPDGVGGTNAYNVYCDMTNDGGGWSLVMRGYGGTSVDNNTWGWSTTNAYNSPVSPSPTQTTTFKYSDLVINNIRGSTGIYRLKSDGTYSFTRFFGSFTYIHTGDPDVVGRTSYSNSALNAGARTGDINAGNWMGLNDVVGNGPQYFMTNWLGRDWYTGDGTNYCRGLYSGCNLNMWVR